jgi:hypothetical protein
MALFIGGLESCKVHVTILTVTGSRQRLVSPWLLTPDVPEGKLIAMRVLVTYASRYGATKG